MALFALFDALALLLLLAPLELLAELALPAVVLPLLEELLEEEDLEEAWLRDATRLRSRLLFAAYTLPLDALLLAPLLPLLPLLLPLLLLLALFAEDAAFMLLP